jgi:hypothetical protein
MTHLQLFREFGGDGRVLYVPLSLARQLFDAGLLGLILRDRNRQALC